MTLRLALKVWPLVERDDEKHNSKIYSRNFFGLQRRPLFGLMVETGPTLPEEHRCAPLIVQDDPK